MQKKLTVTSLSASKNLGCDLWRRSEVFSREGFSLETCWIQCLFTLKNPRSSGMNKWKLWRGNIRHYHRLGINGTLLVPLSTMTVALTIVIIIGCKIVNMHNGCWQPNITAKGGEATFDRQDTRGLFAGFSHNSNKQINTILQHDMFFVLEV